MKSVIKPNIGSESRFLPTPPALTPPLGEGVPVQNIAMTFDVEKRMVWLYPMVKKTEDMFVLTESTNVTDTHTRTDVHRMTANAALT